MYIDKTKLFTIGQFSSIHGVTKKTLMWYDKVGLLKPAIIGEKGYRYYTYEQSSLLETILMLRELNVSISEIKDFLSNRSASNLEKLLREKIKEVERNIIQLKNMQKTLISRHQDMMNLLYIDLSKISIIDKKKSYLAIVPLLDENQECKVSENEIKKVIEETQKYKIRRFHDAVYGSMISVENLYQEKFNNYYALYINVPYSVPKKTLHLQPAGKYIRAFCKGSWDKLSEKYKQILSYAKKNRLCLCGYAYESGINETVINDFNEYITMIEIPIKKE